MSKIKDTNLWSEYKRTNDVKLRNDLIIKYAPLVKVVTNRLYNSMGGMVEQEELQSYGVFGLIDAIDKYDTSMSNKFETYATQRIRGAILDAIRKTDHVSRTYRAKQKEFDTAYYELEEAGIKPTSEAMMEKLNLTKDRYYKLVYSLETMKKVSFEEHVETAGELQTFYTDHDPQAVLDKKELSDKLAESLNILTDNERKVILMYYYEDMTQLEISKVLNVSESRVSQLHTKALRKMHKPMGDYINLLSA